MLGMRDHFAIFSQVRVAKGGLEITRIAVPKWFIGVTIHSRLRIELPEPSFMKLVVYEIKLNLTDDW
jgi:hypothetical protein